MLQPNNAREAPRTPPQPVAVGHGARRGALVLAAAVSLWCPERASAQTATTPATASPAARVHQLAAAGEAAAARVFADSVLVALSPDDDGYPEVLFARASVATNAADAERDYLRVSVEYPRAPRAGEALLRLAQLELARGDRGSARRHLDRLLREYPDGAQTPRAAFWFARMAFEDGNPVRACEALAIAQRQVASNDVELSNQIVYLQPRCTTAVLATAPESTRTVPAEVPLVSGDTSDAARDDSAGRATPGTRYSVQVGAYPVARDANAHARRLKARGFDVRVTGSAKPYRVRIGRYATRADADAALARVKKAGLNGIVVEAERR